MNNFFLDSGYLDTLYLEKKETPPLHRNSPGKSGEFSFDEYNFYICTSGDGITGEWKVVSLNHNWVK